MNIVIYGNILVSLPDIIDLIGQGVIIYTLVMMVIVFIIGYLVTYNSEKDHRITAAFMSAMPNAGISILLANSAFNDPDTLLMVIIGGNLINLALVWIAKWINNREQA